MLDTSTLTKEEAIVLQLALIEHYVSIEKLIVRADEIEWSPTVVASYENRVEIAKRMARQCVNRSIDIRFGGRDA